MIMPELSYMLSGASEPRAGWNAAADGQGAALHASDNNSGSSFFMPNSTSSSGKASIHGGQLESNCANNNIPMNNNGSGDADAHARKDSGEPTTEYEKWIWVLDPLTRKLRVPLSQLVPTQATATTGTVPSLCISFLEGRCRHQWCRQAHVLPCAIPQLRHEALHAPTCCRLHDDPHDTSVLTSRFKYIRVVNNTGSNNANTNGDNDNDASDLISTDRVAQTVGLLRFMAHSVPPPKRRQHSQTSAKEGSNSRSADTGDLAGEADKSLGKSATDDTDDDRELVLDLPAKLICRLHLSHRCRYLEDCNNIHICRECELRLQPPSHVMTVLSTVTPATRTVTVGDTCYAATQLAVGEVTDEEFRVICEQQRHAFLPQSWGDSQSVAPHKSPLMYGGSGASSIACGSASPPMFAAGKLTADSKVTANNATSNAAVGCRMLFPGLTAGGQSGGESPISAGALLQGGQSHAGPQPVARALRIYDVRSKANQTNASSNSNNTNNNVANNILGAPSCGNVAKNNMGGSGAKNHCNGGVRGAGGSGGHHPHGHHHVSRHAAVKGANS
ncbi:uncharacterized protein Tco025E_05553 [Trypanosoma conorhini]|uniref:C3H1-type domain-containing protein n=1 Tax=Trypanosoma conorhini TaxID=83891 RepID=A0A3R7P0Q2_9TRYP|nr:uncharacterized protein Tco025E_05553 [Trypanosoma conorhini]RNF15256.1 hypothetical protein Tco025E_05553 [Trypanosoma conorhini]